VHLLLLTIKPSPKKRSQPYRLKPRQKAKTKTGQGGQATEARKKSQKPDLKPNQRGDSKPGNPTGEAKLQMSATSPSGGEAPPAPRSHWQRRVGDGTETVRKSAPLNQTGKLKVF